MKIVINGCYGGFGISKHATEEYLHRKGLTVYPQENVRFPSLGPTYYLEPPRIAGPELLDDLGDPVDDREWFSQYDLERDDPVLVSVVEDLGEHANGDCADLRVVEVPDGVEWEISDYDGIEHVAEKHRTWA